MISADTKAAGALVMVAQLVVAVKVKVDMTAVGVLEA